MRLIIILSILVLSLSWCQMIKENKDIQDNELNTENITTDEEAIILSRYREMRQAMVDKDIEKLDEIVADWTVFTHMSGKTQSKQEYFSDIKSWRLDYQNYKIENPDVIIEWDMATLRARVSLTANAYWAQWTWPFNVSAHFKKIDGIRYYIN